MIRPPLRSTLFPYTTLFRSGDLKISPSQFSRLHRGPFVLPMAGGEPLIVGQGTRHCKRKNRPGRLPRGPGQAAEDRKSTRLNSSHLGISYAVFCLKKKRKEE